MNRLLWAETAGVPALVVFSWDRVASSLFSERGEVPARLTAFAQIARPEPSYLEFALFMQSLMKDLRSSPCRFFLSARFVHAFILSFWLAFLSP